MSHRTLTAIAVLFFSLCWCPCRGVFGGEGKTRSLFMPRELRARALANIRQDEGAARLRDQLVERARPWTELSDDQIWGLMFGPGGTGHRRARGCAEARIGERAGLLRILVAVAMSRRDYASFSWFFSGAEAAGPRPPSVSRRRGDTQHR
jgi:hypothetical protein